MFIFNPICTTPLGRTIWSEIKRQAAEGLLSEDVADAFYMFNLRNACEAFLRAPDTHATGLRGFLAKVPDRGFEEAHALEIYCDRVLHFPSDYATWFLLLSLAKATMHFYDHDPRSRSRAAEERLEQVLRECDDHASASLTKFVTRKRT